MKYFDLFTPFAWKQFLKKSTTCAVEVLSIVINKTEYKRSIHVQLCKKDS